VILLSNQIRRPKRPNADYYAAYQTLKVRSSHKVFHNLPKNQVKNKIACNQDKKIKDIDGR
jgi:hypothetical protein